MNLLGHSRQAASPMPAGPSLLPQAPIPPPPVPTSRPAPACTYLSSLRCKDTWGMCSPRLSHASAPRGRAGLTLTCDTCLVTACPTRTLPPLQALFLLYAKV